MESESEKGLLNKATIERAIRASKLVLLCVGAISTATLFKVAVIPCVLDLALSTVPQIRASFRSWVSPLYIYLALNFIIAAIAASSTFHHHRHRNVNQNHDSIKTTHKSTYSNSINNSTSLTTEKSTVTSWESFHIVQEDKKYEEEEKKSEESPPDKDEDNDENDIFVGGGYGDEDMDEEGPPAPPAGETLRSSGGGGAESSMEETWKAIMENRRRLERSQTMAGPRRLLERADGEDDRRRGKVEGEEETAAAVWARKEMKKSETFTDRVSLRRYESMSPEELNLRAEALIKKVNNDMRLQRLESEQRFRDLVNRGF